MLILIDNYDSFTYNLVHYLGGLGACARSTATTRSRPTRCSRPSPRRSCLSGPCTPNEAGICLDLIAKAGPQVPLLGVCLGQQAIGQVYGGQSSARPNRCTASSPRSDTRARACSGTAAAVRGDALSLIVERASLPADLEVTAETADGIIMGLQHRAHPVHAVQFHPESIAWSTATRCSPIPQLAGLSPRRRNAPPRDAA